MAKCVPSTAFIANVASMPTREEVTKALEAQLQDMQKNGPHPDVLTFAGNGEPTANPHFPEIIEDTIRLRDKYFPDAKVSVLSNATLIHRPKIHDALMKVDNNIQKLDTIDAAYIYKVDRPEGEWYQVDQVIEGLKRFNGHVIIQTMFLKGSYKGESVNNTGEEYVGPWLDAVKVIAPQQVMIYTIDRETPAQGLLKATHEELDDIRDRVLALGIPCTASY